MDGNKEELSYPMDWNAQSILQLRHRAGLTQKQLAEWLRVTTKQVKHLENKRRNPSGPVTHLLDILKEQEEGRSPVTSSQSPIVILSATQREVTQPSKQATRRRPAVDNALPPAVEEVKELEPQPEKAPDAAVSSQDDAFLWQT